MRKKLFGAAIACISLAVCFSLGALVVNAEDGDGNGNTPTPLVCSHPMCWQA